MIKYVLFHKGRLVPFNSITPARQIYVLHSRPGMSNTQCIFYFILSHSYSYPEVWRCIVSAIFESLWKLAKEEGEENL